MKCCGKCFGDQGLEREIGYLTSETGTCDYCGSKKVTIIPPESLQVKFEPLLDAYVLNKKGKPLAHWLKTDWKFFPQMDEAHAQMLLADIFDDGELVRHLRIPSSDYDSKSLGDWDRLRDELKYQNRFFPGNHVNLTILATLLPLLALKSNDLSEKWHRARMIKSEEGSFSSDEMKAPPQHLTPHGRANPAGIPYLYLGSEVATSVSEIRPHTGEIACVAEFFLQRGLEFIDLRHPRESISPFSGGMVSLGQLRCYLEFLERLGYELTRPVSRFTSAVDYTPSQYLCEFIKKSGYDGVLYRSSVSQGVNLALFYPDKATIGNLFQHKVDNVRVEISPVIINS